MWMKRQHEYDFFNYASLTIIERDILGRVISVMFLARYHRPLIVPHIVTVCLRFKRKLWGCPQNPSHDSVRERRSDWLSITIHAFVQDRLPAHWRPLAFPSGYSLSFPMAHSNLLPAIATLLSKAITCTLFNTSSTPRFQALIHRPTTSWGSLLDVFLEVLGSLSDPTMTRPPVFHLASESATPVPQSSSRRKVRSMKNRDRRTTGMKELSQKGPPEKEPRKKSKWRQSNKFPPSVLY
ncbi:hypothetical protein F5887DRAFT_914572 [Amanita rubescens]|nr:hypothetical protein F5887DRAFT_921640 [Amanita rubescens]KAF8348788.1 hypothetical protein F5887DRAFT_914572 [Amanita rubescens]